MHIIISILKIAGISVMVLVLLLVFLLILFLFVPFYYRMYGCIPEKGTEHACSGNVEAKVTVQFLAFLLMISLEYTEKGLKGVLRILGIPVKRIGEEKKPSKEQGKGRTGKKQKKQAKQVKTEEGKKEKGEAERQTEEQKEQAGQKEQAERRKGEERTEEQDKKEQTDRTAEDSRKEENIHRKSRLDRYFYKAADVWKQIGIAKEKITDTCRNEHIRNAVSIVWKRCGQLLKHILPRKVQMQLHFGCSDPAMTGQMLGMLSMVYAFYGDAIKIKPDFEQPVLDGEIRLCGQLRMFFLLKIAWLLYRDKEVRYLLSIVKGSKERK